MEDKKKDIASNTTPYVFHIFSYMSYGFSRKAYKHWG